MLGIKPNAKKPIQTLSAVLGQLGLELEYLGRVQMSQSLYNKIESSSGLKNKRHRTYRLLEESLDRMKSIAERTRRRVIDNFVDHLQDIKPYLKNQQPPLDPKLAVELEHRLDVLDEVYDDLYEPWLMASR